jgi:hypothetical protein
MKQKQMQTILAKTMIMSQLETADDRDSIDHALTSLNILSEFMEKETVHDLEMIIGIKFAALDAVEKGAIVL